jgi:hypothetical protein
MLLRSGALNTGGALCRSLRVPFTLRHYLPAQTVEMESPQWDRYQADEDTSMNTISKGLFILGLASGAMTANAAVSAVTAATDGSLLVYDSLNNATWPANTNLFASQYSEATVQAIEKDAAGLKSLKGYTLSDTDFSSSGTMTWYGALAWVNYLNVINYGGSSRWSLPKSITGQDIAGYPDGIGADPSPSTSQMATLFYLELGQVAGISINTTNNGAGGYDLFSNLQDAGYSIYWGRTPDTYVGVPDYPWTFNINGGTQYGTYAGALFWAMPVTPEQVNSAPAVTPVVTGTLGSNGWYVSNPTTLAWSVPGLPKPTKSGCGTVNVPETTGKSYTCSATNEFGNASNSVTIKIDSIPPTIAVKTPASGATYALNQIVAAAYTCADAKSGLASCAGPVADGAHISTSTAGMQTFAVIATDNAGNTLTKSVAYNIVPPAATPLFSLKAGTYSATQTVSITDASANATIYYTVDGTTPTTSSPQYGGTITVSSTETLKADAYAPGFARSAVRTASYTIQ